MTESIEVRFAEWLVSPIPGMSSLAIAARMLSGRTLPDAYNSRAYPHDIHDFYRCTMLLARIPEWRRRIGEMADVSPVWARLAEHWDELERLYFASEADRKTVKWSLTVDAFHTRLREVTAEPQLLQKMQQLPGGGA
jgi:hypothetical protein